MKAESGLPVNVPPPGQQRMPPLPAWPGTRLGWWSVGLATTFVVLYIINTTVFMRMTGQETWGPVVLPFYGIFMMLCGLVSGITALIAVTRKHERSWLVWLPLLAGLFVLVFLLGEFLVPH